MRYGKKQAAARTFNAGSLYPGGFPRLYLTANPPSGAPSSLAHRASLEAEWAALSPRRAPAWSDELNTLATMGPHRRPRADHHQFPGLPHPLSTCLVPPLQAIDRHGDDAIDTLLPVLQVSRKMQPAAHTLVRQMVAVVIERGTTAVARWVLDNATVLRPPYCASPRP